MGRDVWITDMGYEKRRYKKTGDLRNADMEKNGKISLTEHNHKLRSAGNDWRRKRQRKWNQEIDKGNGTKTETKEMERT